MSRYVLVFCDLYLHDLHDLHDLHVVDKQCTRGCDEHGLCASNTKKNA